MIAFIQAHAVAILGALLTLSEGLALVFPNATGILKAISLLKGAGIKDADGQ